MECVPVAYPGAERPVSFVFLLGGNYTGQNNFLFPPSLSSPSPATTYSYSYSLTQFYTGQLGLL